MASPRSGSSNWRVACDTDDYCLATAVSAARGTFHLGRPARETYWEVSFTPAGPPPARDRPVIAGVDGKALAFAAPADIAPFGRPRDFYFLGPQAQALFDRLVPGKVLTIGFTDVDGRDETMVFPLDGLAQALIAIDGAQHRIGSERVAAPPPYGRFRADVPGAAWMQPALAHYR